MVGIDQQCLETTCAVVTSFFVDVRFGQHEDEVHPQGGTKIPSPAGPQLICRMSSAAAVVERRTGSTPTSRRIPFVSSDAVGTDSEQTFDLGALG